jgi:hypothetical protein
LFDPAEIDRIVTRLAELRGMLRAQRQSAPTDVANQLLASAAGHIAFALEDLSKPSVRGASPGGGTTGERFLGIDQHAGERN